MAILGLRVWGESVRMPGKFPGMLGESIPVEQSQGEIPRDSWGFLRVYGLGFRVWGLGSRV